MEEHRKPNKIKSKKKKEKEKNTYTFHSQAAGNQRQRDNSNGNLRKQNFTYRRIKIILYVLVFRNNSSKK